MADDFLMKIGGWFHLSGFMVAFPIGCAFHGGISNGHLIFQIIDVEEWHFKVIQIWTLGYKLRILPIFVIFIKWRILYLIDVDVPSFIQLFIWFLNW